MLDVRDLIEKYFQQFLLINKETGQESCVNLDWE